MGSGMFRYSAVSLTVMRLCGAGCLWAEGRRHGKRYLIHEKCAPSKRGCQFGLWQLWRIQCPISARPTLPERPRPSNLPPYSTTAFSKARLCATLPVSVPMSGLRPLRLTPRIERNAFPVALAAESALPPNKFRHMERGPSVAQPERFNWKASTSQARLRRTAARQSCSGCATQP